MTPEQLQQVLQQALGSQPPWYVTVLLAALVGGVVAYFGPYLAEKARMRAIEENLGRLVEQVHQTTRVAEDIKTQIAGGLWLGQKRWDLKRDLYTRLLENLGTFIAHMDGLAKLKDQEQDEQTRTLTRQYYQAAMGAYREILQANWTASLFLNEPAQETLHTMRSYWSEANELDEADVGRIIVRLTTAARKAYAALVKAASEDLMALKLTVEPRIQEAPQ